MAETKTTKAKPKVTKATKSKEPKPAPKKRTLKHEGFETQKTKSLDLLDAVKDHPLYKQSAIVPRSEKASRVIEEQCESYTGYLLPGHMYVFRYLTPKTKDELEYYDAMPCVIIFGTFKTKTGEVRELGFNLHYFPPNARFMIMSELFRMFRPIFMKYFEGQNKEIDAFDYRYIIDTISKNKLEFGIREYIPRLRTKVYHIHPSWFATALFTEGRFMKDTRVRILKYWEKYRGR